MTATIDEMNTRPRGATSRFVTHFAVITGAGAAESIAVHLGNWEK